MGFSVSSSFAVIAFGAFVAMSAAYGAAANAAENRQAAQADQRAHRDAIVETSINVTSTDVSITGCRLTVEANNTGSTTLSVNDTDLLVDGEYRTDWRASATVNGDADTDLWLPGERLSISVTDGITAAPDRVKIVTGPGVAVTERIGGGVVC